MADAQAAALRDVAVRYPGRPPLGPLDLTVAAGEIVALVGASGAGKSTLLHIAGLLEQADGGEIRNGSDLPRKARAEKILGLATAFGVHSTRYPDQDNAITAPSDTYHY